MSNYRTGDYRAGTMILRLGIGMMCATFGFGALAFLRPEVFRGFMMLAPDIGVYRVGLCLIAVALLFVMGRVSWRVVQCGVSMRQKGDNRV